MNRRIQALLGASAPVFAAHASASLTFYANQSFTGRSFAINQPVNDFYSIGRKETASSVWVESGRWEICSEPNYRGRCVVLRRGGYESLKEFGMNNTVASARPIRDNRRYENEAAAPVDRPEYAYRRRHQERVFDAPITDVRAVMGPPTQRCWVERQAVQQQPNIGGAVIGGVIGGILGHQVGGGSGKDLATGAGVVGGAVVGSNVANGSGGRQDVQRCQQVAGGPPAYYDVSYNFRGRLHHAQMTAPPQGNTIPVNERGEPRY
ncbi:glycine zipper 2TM domain-containing protein [Ramlibacter terrae]|uniref:Glycine zipper 2TM domain-containing protein n=1 Tax=Ramlibacter terrae TaxID=2732511 RepID=A0ABX6P0Z7_9BURK|nr:glycine zipper 2TM domain-containing protein [Ramlibacter terrae]